MENGLNCVEEELLRAQDEVGFLRIVLKYFSLFFINENIYCNPSLELSHRDSFNGEVTTYVYKEYYGKLSLNYLCYSFLSGTLINGSRS